MPAADHQGLNLGTCQPRMALLPEPTSFIELLFPSRFACHSDSVRFFVGNAIEGMEVMEFTKYVTLRDGIQQLSPNDVLELSQWDDATVWVYLVVNGMPGPFVVEVDDDISKGTLLS